MPFVLSDFHGNRPATRAVGDYIQSLGRSREAWTLGDYVGYGSDPRYCLEWAIQNASVRLLGNHDDALTSPGMLSLFSGTAREPLEWTIEELSQGSPLSNGMMPLDFVSGLQPEMQIGEVGIAHASPYSPLITYLFPLDHPLRWAWRSEDALALEDAFSMGGRLYLVGHTHIPGIFLKDANGVITFTPSAQVPAEFELPHGAQAIINVGSVGQPRDLDPRACFLELDDDCRKVTFHRVPYDVDEIVNEMKAIPRLAANADRLLKGA